MAKTVAELATDLVSVSQNPQMMARVVTGELEAGGVNIVHPSDPVLFAIESSIMSGHAIMQSIDGVLPKIFASMTTSRSDIYRHLSDKDALNIFTLPSSSEFSWAFDVDELKQAAKPIEGSDIKKVVIPVNTEYKAKDLFFAQPYPLEIRFLPHDGIQVRWDNGYDNPFTFIDNGSLDYTLNKVNYEDKRIELIVIKVPVEQYRTKYYLANTVPNIVWSETYTLTDSFYACRVRYRNQGNWVTMKVAMSIETIDPLTPTVVIEPTETKVKLTIPEIYINSGLVSGEIAIEILESRGAITKSFSNYQGDDFSYVFKDHTGFTNTLYTNVFKQISLATLYSTSSTQGGRDELDTMTLRARMIENTLGEVKSPLSDSQLEATLEDKGYNIYKVVDVLSSRVYLAALELPTSDIKTISGPIGCANDNIVLSFDELNNHPGIRVNGNRYTLTDECLFSQNGSNTTLFADHTLKTLNWLSNVDKIDYLSNRQLLSLPYHVVIDTNNNVIESRMYALSKPKIVSRRLETTNDYVNVTVSTKTAELTMTETGYRLRVMTKSNDAYKELDYQNIEAILSFDGTTGRAFKRGTLVGSDTETNEYLWEWEIETNLDIDRNHNILIEGFTDNNNISFEMAVGLLSEFNIAYTILGTFDDGLLTDADDYTRNDYQGLAITHERHMLQFGQALESMWVYARPIPGTLQFEVYEEDVQATYSRDVIRFNKIEDGVPVYETVHAKGDPIFEADGTPRIRFLKGTPVVKDGKPVLKEERKLRVEIDLWLVDARFKVTTIESVAAYNEFWFDHIISHSLTTIPEIGKNTLDRTELKLTAKNTISRVKVMLGNEVINYIPAEQKFSIKYYVTNDVRQNQELLKQIKTITSRVIHNVLIGAETVSTVGIGKALKEALDEYIVDVTVEEFENAVGSKYFTVLDQNANIGIAKRLTLTNDNKLTIEDDISISYLNYKK